MPASKTKTLILLLQETRCTCVDKLVIPNFALAGSILSRKHSLDTFVHESLSWTQAGQSLKDSDIEWLCVDVAGLKIINVYKPPSSCLLTTSLPVFPFPYVYAGDFNCQHVQWGDTEPIHPTESVWLSGQQIITLMLLHNPKGAASFTSRRWNTRTNSDLAFVSARPDNRLPDRCVLEKFPRSQHRSSLITAIKLVAPVPSEPEMVK